MDRTMEMNNDFNLIGKVDETIVDAFNFPKNVFSINWLNDQSVCSSIELKPPT